MLLTRDEEQWSGISKELREDEDEEHRVARHLEDRPVHCLVLRVFARDDALADKRDTAQAHHKGDEA